MADLVKGKLLISFYNVSRFEPGATTSEVYTWRYSAHPSRICCRGEKGCDVQLGNVDIMSLQNITKNHSTDNLYSFGCFLLSMRLEL